MSKIKPLWAKQAEKKLIDAELSKKALANKIGVNYTQMISVMSGGVINERIAARICDFLKIER